MEILLSLRKTPNKTLYTHRSGSWVALELIDIDRGDFKHVPRPAPKMEGVGSWAQGGNLCSVTAAGLDASSTARSPALLKGASTEARLRRSEGEGTGLGGLEGPRDWIITRHQHLRA